MVEQNPTGWEMTGDVGTWAESWADEIMPLAKQAHDRLKSIDFAKMTSKTPKVRCTWTADRAQEQLAKAGFRLAAMLRSIYE